MPGGGKKNSSSSSRSSRHDDHQQQRLPLSEEEQFRLTVMSLINENPIPYQPKGTPPSDGYNYKRNEGLQSDLVERAMRDARDRIKELNMPAVFRTNTHVVPSQLLLSHGPYVAFKESAVEFLNNLPEDDFCFMPLWTSDAVDTQHSGCATMHYVSVYWQVGIRDTRIWWSENLDGYRGSEALVMQVAKLISGKEEPREIRQIVRRFEGTRYVNHNTCGWCCINDFLKFTLNQPPDSRSILNIHALTHKDLYDAAIDNLIAIKFDLDDEQQQRVVPDDRDRRAEHEEISCLLEAATTTVTKSKQEVPPASTSAPSPQYEDEVEKMTGFQAKFVIALLAHAEVKMGFTKTPRPFSIGKKVYQSTNFKPSWMSKTQYSNLVKQATQVFQEFYCGDDTATMMRSLRRDIARFSKKTRQDLTDSSVPFTGEEERNSVVMNPFMTTLGGAPVWAQPFDGEEGIFPNVQAALQMKQMMLLLLNHDHSAALFNMFAGELIRQSRSFIVIRQEEEAAMCVLCPQLSNLTDSDTQEWGLAIVSRLLSEVELHLSEKEKRSSRKKKGRKKKRKQSKEEEEVVVAEEAFDTNKEFKQALEGLSVPLVPFPNTTADEYRELVAIMVDVYEAHPKELSIEWENGEENSRLVTVESFWHFAHTAFKYVKQRPVYYSFVLYLLRMFSESILDLKRSILPAPRDTTTLDERTTGTNESITDLLFCPSFAHLQDSERKHSEYVQ